MPTFVRYIGPHDMVDVPDAGLVGLKRNHKVEVDDDLAKNLVLQDVWELVEEKPAKPAPKADKE